MAKSRETQKGSERLLATAEQVEARITEMATGLIDRYRDDNPLFVCFMKGGVPFTARLMMEVARQDPNFHPEVDYMIISTYGQGRMANDPEIVTGLAPGVIVEGRTIVMVDDVLDTGATMGFAKRYFEEKLGAEKIESIVLVNKIQERTLYTGKPVLTGFEVEDDEWLSGMGMDDASLGPEANRWSGDIAIV